MANHIPSYRNHLLFSTPAITSTIAAYLVGNRTYATNNLFDYNQNATLREIFSQTEKVTYQQIQDGICELETLPPKASLCLPLEELDFSGWEINDSFLSRLSQILIPFCPQLNSVNLANTPKLTDIGLQAFALSRPPLRFLNIQGPLLPDNQYRPRLTDEGFHRITLQFPFLTSINLAQCTDISDLGMQSLSRHCPSLTSIDISTCVEVTNKGLNFFGEHLHSLTSIRVSMIEEISDEGVIDLAEGCPQLTLVDLGGCRAVSDISLRALSINCPRLVSLDLFDCDKVTFAGIHILLESCPCLNSMNLTKCTLLNEEEQRLLTELFPRLTLSQEETPLPHDNLNESFDDYYDGF